MQPKLKSLLLVITLFLPIALVAQDIPDEFGGVIYKGNIESIARGVLDGNLIQTNFRNHGELSRWSDNPWGVWPRDIGGRHIDGVGVVIAGKVPGERAKWSEFGGKADTTLNPVIIRYRQAGIRSSPYTGEAWGWLPLPGFNNPNRENAQGQAEPVPALSNDPSSWPSFWPDRLSEDDPGWAGTWNGRDGRFASADLESYYVMDDFSDLEYAYGLETAGPHSEFGVYIPNPADSTIGGFASQMKVRIFQWANLLAEDTMFLIYSITNKGAATQDSMYFSQIVDYGLGNEETDDNATYDPILDLVYGFDSNGIGTPSPQGGIQTTYALGYTGFAFLESPANDNNMLDDDSDGIIDESRFETNNFVLTTTAEIEAYVDANYDRALFEEFYSVLEERPAYITQRWFPSDENMDWVTFEDTNGNGIRDEGEPLNNDIGRDGLSTFDFGYPGPDDGEGDGMPTQGEPNYNDLDVDESDQIGLSGFELNTRPFYETANLNKDTWLFNRLELALFDDPTQEPPAETLADNEPFIFFISGPVQLGSANSGLKNTDFFSTAWIFGDDEIDFFKNRRIVQNIYNADYNFAQPPLEPTLDAQAGDGKVTLSWDDVSVRSFDRFLQEFDFEGYKLYKSTDNIFSSARTITDVNGNPKFFQPIARWDLDNDVNGYVPVLDGEAVYDLGSDTGLEFSYLDEDVVNGKIYYYAIVAYDRGVVSDGGAPGIDPQESPFRIAVNSSGLVTSSSKSSSVVIPTTPPAGFVAGSAVENLTTVTTGTGTGAASVSIVSENLLNESVTYRASFTDTASTLGDFRVTESFKLSIVDPSKNSSNSVASDSVLIDSTTFVSATKIIDGFVLNLMNSSSGEVIANKTGYISNEGTENELYSLNPADLDGLNTDWVVSIEESESSSAVTTDSDYELLFADSLYETPRIRGTSFLTRYEIPLFARNINTDEPATILMEDVDGDTTLSVGDRLSIIDIDGRTNKFRFDFSFTGTNSNAPVAGDKIIISTTRAFGSDDTFDFTMRKGSVDNEIAKNELEDIFVAPNPYVGAASWERKSTSFGRGERKITFFNLPQKCTIRIFNVRGELIRTIEHDGNFNDGSADWDLLTNNNEDVAYGVYFYHVSAPGVGEYVDKFAVVK